MPFSPEWKGDFPDVAHTEFDHDELQALIKHAVTFQREHLSQLYPDPGLSAIAVNPLALPSKRHPVFRKERSWIEVESIDLPSDEPTVNVNLYEVIFDANAFWRRPALAIGRLIGIQGELLWSSTYRSHLSTAYTETDLSDWDATTPLVEYVRSRKPDFIAYRALTPGDFVDAMEMLEGGINDFRAA